MLAALLNVYITTKFGVGVVPLTVLEMEQIICFGSSLQAFAYCLQCWAPPFPLFCVAQVFNGAGLGLQDAQVRPPAFLFRIEQAELTRFLATVNRPIRS
jgi:hypothetical protein